MQPTPGNLAILGSTGSIGRQTLDIVARNRDMFRIVALSAQQNIELLSRQVLEFQPEVVVVGDESGASELRKLIGSSAEILVSTEGLRAAATHSRVHTVVAGIVGVAGLESVFAAVQSGKHIALANKESMVAAGELLQNELKISPSVIVPVDSEHNSLFQCLNGRNVSSEVSKLVLTASGGPFLNRSLETLGEVTPEQAVLHPRWSMGAKISVDSATLMNKALEVIEACYLFSVPEEKIDVLIHPQSAVHAMVQYIDGAVCSLLSVTDMRIPISHALGYLHSENPQAVAGGRISENGVPPLELGCSGPLEFFPVDNSRFPAISLARQALQHSFKQGKTAPMVLNAANEVAVSAFLAGKLGFTKIVSVVEKVLETSDLSGVGTLHELLSKDADIREQTSRVIFG